MGGDDGSIDAALSGFGAGAGARGFNELARYLFGDGNEEGTAMAMTMPVEVSETSMAFVLPRANADAPPAPRSDAAVRIDAVPARLVATASFGGLVTPEEVARQEVVLREALAAAGIAPVPGAEVSVLQYNSPAPIPWRRRNEVAIVVDDEEPTASATPQQSAKSARDAAIKDAVARAKAMEAAAEA